MASDTPDDARTTYSNVRSALGVEQSEVSNDGLDFAIDKAGVLVDREVAPHTTRDIAAVETYLAAYLHIDDTEAGNAPVSSLKQSSRTVSFDTGEQDSLKSDMWEKAVLFDPTNRVENLLAPDASVNVPDTKGIK